MSASSEQKKATLERITGLTPWQRASVASNRDALSLLSLEDRSRYSGQFAVIVRRGESIGQVVGSADSMREAVKIAQSLPKYQPQNYWVRFVHPRKAVQS
jgi:hypothetical protein